MRNTSGIVTLGRTLTPGRLVALLTVAWLVWAPGLKLFASPQASLQAVTDRITYNAGDQVRLRIIFPSSRAEQPPVRYLFTLRYAGEAKAVTNGLVLSSAEGSSPGYRMLWKSPLDARAGRYEIDLCVQDARSQVIQDLPRICSFVIHRQVIQIISAEVTEPYYTSGDTIGCSVKIENLTGRTLPALRLEFSERYWPWIVQQKERVGGEIANLQNAFTLKPHQRIAINPSRCAVAKKVEQPAIEQYAAVVWDHDRKNVYAIAFTPLVFVNPPGVVAPRPYPSQYLYSSLEAEAVKIANYRHFRPEPFAAGAIQFDTHHTLFPSGGTATVRFSLANPTDEAWRQVMVRARLLDPDGTEQANQVVTERVD